MTEDEYTLLKKVTQAVDAILIGMKRGYGADDWYAVCNDWERATKELRSRLQAVQDAKEYK